MKYATCTHRFHSTDGTVLINNHDQATQKNTSFDSHCAIHSLEVVHWHKKRK